MTRHQKQNHSINLNYPFIHWGKNNESFLFRPSHRNSATVAPVCYTHNCNSFYLHQSLSYSYLLSNQSAMYLTKKLILFTSSFHKSNKMSFTFVLTITLKKIAGYIIKSTNRFWSKWHEDRKPEEEDQYC